MPSVSGAQHRAMAAAMSGKSTLGIPKSVGADFVHADKGKTFAHGGSVEHKQLAKQATAHADHAKGTGQTFAAGGTVGSMPMPPTMGVSSAYPPPSGHRTEGPRNYGKK
jgi:hypothetical protein